MNKSEIKVKMLKRDNLMLMLVLYSIAHKEAIDKREINYLKQHKYLDDTLNKENVNLYNQTLESVNNIMEKDELDALDKAALQMNKDILYQLRTMLYDNIIEKVNINLAKIGY